MHPADAQEFEKLTKERAELRRLLNEVKDDLRRANEKLERYRREIKALAHEVDTDG